MRMDEIDYYLHMFRYHQTLLYVVSIFHNPFEYREIGDFRKHLFKGREQT